MRYSTSSKKTLKLHVSFNRLFMIRYVAGGKEKIYYLKDKSIMELNELGQPIIVREVDYPIFPSSTKPASVFKSAGLNELNMIKCFLS
ncbi:MAG: hypothetical protein HQ522_07450 [Bacteroidetes bacterium]|nr:hypothetical protein [Bacteroidota bacterium]